MFRVKKGEIETRLFEDMADSRSGKLDDEMTKLGLRRPSHLLEAGTNHRSSSRLKSVVRQDEIKPGNVLVHGRLGGCLVECDEVRRRRARVWLEVDGDNEAVHLSGLRTFQ